MAKKNELGIMENGCLLSRKEDQPGLLRDNSRTVPYSLPPLLLIFLLVVDVLRIQYFRNNLYGNGMESTLILSNSISMRSPRAVGKLIACSATVASKINFPRYVTSSFDLSESVSLEGYPLSPPENHLTLPVRVRLSASVLAQAGTQRGVSDDDGIAIDGKTMSGTSKKKGEQTHVFGALTHERGIQLTQKKSPPK